MTRNPGLLLWITPASHGPKGLLAVKQKWGTLAFQALPRPWKPGGKWTYAERARLDAVTEAFADRSEDICERCGGDGSLRESRRVHVVLCDRCESLVPEHGRL